MSELGNINKSFGKQTNISVANTHSANVLNSTILPNNMIIVSSPIDSDGNDIGTYCLLATDNNGAGVRLTYTIQPGNGLNVDNFNGDIIKLDVDNSILNTNNNDKLQVNIENIVDDNTIFVENDKIHVNTSNLPIANKTDNGVVLIDNSTTKISDNGNLYVNAENLDKANEDSFGVVTSDNNTIRIDSNGVISVNTSNLVKTTPLKYGVVKVDGTTINSTYGDISVNTNNLKYCTNSYFGILKPDNKTINVNHGELSVNTQNIKYATNLDYGVTKTDGISLVTNNGTIEVNNYDKIINDITGLINGLDTIETIISGLNEKISNLG